MKIIPLSEGTFTVDKTKHFVPVHATSDAKQAPAQGSLLVEIQPFIVVTAKDIILLDTGLGLADNNGKMQIYQNLLNAGIGPMEVTKVLLTHLHKDHAGGVADHHDRSQLSFSNATYYLQKSELEMALAKGPPSFGVEKLEALKHASQVVLLSENRGVIDDYIHYEVTGAHSRFHQVFWIKENSRIIFFGGDDAPQLRQMKHRWAAKYDFDARKTMELRQKWWRQGQGEGWTFLFYHDIQHPVVKL